VVDAYCGVGVLGLILARHGHQPIGIEMNPAAVADARQAMRRNRITGASVHQGRVEQVLPRLVAGGLKPSAIVLDPPRKGCAKEVLQAVADSKAPRIAYVSCHPGTLARDLVRLRQHGYMPTSIEAVDMFPQTSHLEVLTLLETT
jgi:23S rRNA (uracil1939-C5)-methyltransferase